MSYDPSLLQMLSTREPLRDLMNMSASWSLELTKSVMISPKSTFSHKVTINIHVFSPFMERSDLTQCE